MEEENLKQIFVGPKYAKFEKKVFSIPAFFFGELYFAYRKMLMYAVIVMVMRGLINAVAMQIQNFGLAFVAILCIHTAIGLLFPLWYRSFYSSRVKNILANNADKSEQDKISIAQKSGGTKGIYIILFIIISSVFSSTFSNINMFGTPDTKVDNSNIFFFDSNFENNEIDENEDNSSENDTASISDEGDYEKIENAEIKGYVTTFGSTVVYIGNDMEEYKCSAKNPEILPETQSYDEVSATIYYTEKNGQKTIVKYELYNTETNEKIENVKDENELREKIGYKSEGSYQEKLILVKGDDTAGYASDGEISYIYYTLTLKNEKGKEFEFKYPIYEDTEDKSDTLEENIEYNVKYKVQKDVFGFDYEYVITDIEEI